MDYVEIATLLLDRGANVDDIGRWVILLIRESDNSFTIYLSIFQLYVIYQCIYRCLCISMLLHQFVNAYHYIVIISYYCNK